MLASRALSHHCSAPLLRSADASSSLTRRVDHWPRSDLPDQGRLDQAGGHAILLTSPGRARYATSPALGPVSVTPVDMPYSEATSREQVGGSEGVPSDATYVFLGCRRRDDGVITLGAIGERDEVLEAETEPRTALLRERPSRDLLTHSSHSS